MIGRIDSTPGLPRARHQDSASLRRARSATSLAIGALIAVAGLATSSTTLEAQSPAGKATARMKGIEPLPAGAPEAMPDLGSQVPDQPPAPQPPPGSMPPAVRDDRVRPAELEDKGPLPVASNPPGGAPSVPGSASGAVADPFMLPIDRLGVGKQKVQLSVEVQANPIINLGKESTVRLVVKNESNVDASGVSLVYQLPDGLKINSSTPSAIQLPGTSLYYWPKPMLAAMSEWAVVLKVVATSTRACEHAATVVAKTGSRANTIVQEPKLKVEATSTPSRVLKGEQVHFQIAVTNPGTGPARNVTVQAKLSSGLRLNGEDNVEQTIESIGPGQRIDLEVLTADTIAGGKQSCTVDVRSADVTMVQDDQRITRDVEVTKPELAVKLEGQNERFTGQTNEYKLTVTNTGTAQAKKVKVVATMPPQGGKLLPPFPRDAKFDKATRKLIWSIAQLEPLQSVEMKFEYDTSTPGLYRATAEATSGELRASDTMTTDVSGIAVLDLQVTQTSRVMDVGKTNYYDITIKNSGTKEASRLQLSGNLTKNLKVLKHYNVEKGEFKFDPDSGKFLFPEIDRLGVGQTITLSLEVQASESGPAGCHVFLAHAEMGTEDAKVEDVLSTTVTGNNRSRGSTAKP